MVTTTMMTMMMLLQKLMLPQNTITCRLSVILILNYLQGHPEAPHQWSCHIDQVFTNFADSKKRIPLYPRTDVLCSVVVPDA